MKFERLTENKIRIIIKIEDLLTEKSDSKSLFSNTLESDTLFLQMLEKAEKELDFHTDGCKLLIEAFSSLDDILVFTITKYSQKESKISCYDTSRKRLRVRRKSFNFNKTNIYEFEKFETFCNFCNCVTELHEFDVKKFAQSISLYLYNNTYFLIVKNINNNYKFLNRFFTSISEFAKCSTYSENFESKLLEHGKIIMNKNAIEITTKYFT